MINDDVLVSYVLNGETEYFSYIIERYEGFGYKYAYSLLENHHEAEDALSESFIKVYENINKYNIGTNFKNWFLKIVHNTCFDMLRKNNRLVYLEKEITDTETFTDNLIDKNLIEQALNKLPHDTRSIIILRFYYDLDYKSISDLLEIPMGTIASKLNRGLKNLKKFII